MSKSTNLMSTTAAMVDNLAEKAECPLNWGREVIMKGPVEKGDKRF